MSPLPIINPFEKPYIVYNTHSPTIEEMKINDHNGIFFNTPIRDDIKQIIGNHTIAAKYVLEGNDANEVENYITQFLKNSSEYRIWRENMPSITPQCFKDYQQKSKYSSVELDDYFKNCESFLSEGQVLFRGGKYHGVINQCLRCPQITSTTFCPQVALREAEWNGKAYNDDEINLWLITIRNPQIKIFIYNFFKSKMGNEKEVVLQSDCKFFLREKILINDHYKVFSPHTPNPLSKYVCAYLLYVDVV